MFSLWRRPDPHETARAVSTAIADVVTAIAHAVARVSDHRRKRVEFVKPAEEPAEDLSQYDYRELDLDELREILAARSVEEEDSRKKRRRVTDMMAAFEKAARITIDGNGKAEKQQRQ